MLSFFFVTQQTMRTLVALMLGLSVCSAMAPPPSPPPGVDYSMGDGRMMLSNDSMMMGDMGDMGGMGGMGGMGE